MAATGAGGEEEGEAGDDEMGMGDLEGLAASVARLRAETAQVIIFYLCFWGVDGWRCGMFFFWRFQRPVAISIYSFMIDSLT